jgi:hypothetical protein
MLDKNYAMLGFSKKNDHGIYAIMFKMQLNKILIIIIAGIHA